MGPAVCTARRWLIATLLAVACGPRRAVPADPLPAAVASPVIYFALTDRFANGDAKNDGAHVDRAAPGAYHGGDLTGLRARLPYLAALGVDILWISPVVDNIDEPVAGAGFPDWGYHGYWAKDFHALDEHLGSEADLRAVVVDAHALGMRVLLDVVVNHPGYGARFADDPVATRTPARGDCGKAHEDPLTECLYGLPDFRTEDPAIADPLIAAHLAWASRSGVDGFRVDSARHVGLDVWRRLADRARAARPGFWLLGEAWGAAPGPAAGDVSAYLEVFDALYDFAFADAAFAFVTGAADAATTAAWLTARGPVADRFVTFLNTHDTPGFLHRLGGDKQAFLLAAALLMTAPGMPLIYYGDEAGRAGGEWPANRSDMPWTAADGADDAIQARYRELVAARRRLSGPIRIRHAAGSLLVYERDGGTVLLNAGREPATWNGIDVAPRSARISGTIQRHQGG